MLGCFSLQSHFVSLKFYLFLSTGITTEVKEACRWLESSRSPWPEVLNKWLAAAPFRFKDLFYSEGKHFINDYIEKWSILSHQSGYELVCQFFFPLIMFITIVNSSRITFFSSLQLLQDFKILFPKAKSLFLRFPLFEKRTIDIARRDIKDKFSLGVLRHYKSDLHEGMMSFDVSIIHDSFLSTYVTND